MELRWYVEEIDNGPERRGWPYGMRDKPYARFTRTEPRLQYRGPDGKWIDIPKAVAKRKERTK